ncbi:MAG: hypothetical protein LUE27_08600 [Clostridia bacterium]|nr:hypothetical protein [Clostridia bacterium]
MSEICLSGGGFLGGTEGKMRADFGEKSGKETFFYSHFLALHYIIWYNEGVPVGAGFKAPEQGLREEQNA